jgi:hypothetical protein
MLVLVLVLCQRLARPVLNLLGTVLERGRGDIKKNKKNKKKGTPATVLGINRGLGSLTRNYLGIGSDMRLMGCGQFSLKQ